MVINFIGAFHLLNTVLFHIFVINAILVALALQRFPSSYLNPICVVRQQQIQ